MEDIEVDEIGLGEVLEDEEVQAMAGGIAEGRVDPDAAAQADADFEDFQLKAHFIRMILCSGPPR